MSDDNTGPSLADLARAQIARAQEADARKSESERQTKVLELQRREKWACMVVAARECTQDCNDELAGTGVTVTFDYVAGSSNAFTIGELTVSLKRSVGRPAAQSLGINCSTMGYAALKRPGEKYNSSSTAAIHIDDAEDDELCGEIRSFLVDQLQS